MIKTIDILEASWIITVNKNFDVLTDHSLVIEAGKIINILPQNLAKQEYPQGKITSLEGQALLPGFINTHCHAAMSLLRGMGSDTSLQTWLKDHIWPAEQSWVSKQFVHDGALLANAEMIKSGTTCFNDMYFFPDIVGEVASNCQMRACLSFPVLEFPSIWADNAEDYIQKGTQLHDRYKGNELISTAFGPHAPYTVSLNTFEKISTLAEELDVNIHMHLHENQQEIIEYRQEHKCSAIEHYAEKGLLSPRLQAVHMTQLSEKEIELIAKHQVKIVHCPESNMKLASGILDIQLLQNHGLNISLGTDGSASNNDLDMIGEMKSAALLAKVSSGNASIMDAQSTLAMATIEGAKCLGIDAICGSLESGKFADCISIDLTSIEHIPNYDPVTQIIYSASKSNVSNVWVAGKKLLENGKLMLIDEQALLNKATHWQNTISGK